MKKVFPLLVSIILMSGCVTTTTPQQVQANSLASAMVNRLDLTGKDSGEIIQAYGYPSAKTDSEWTYSLLFNRDGSHISSHGILTLHLEKSVVKGGNYEVDYGEPWGFGDDLNTRYNGLAGIERDEKQEADSEQAIKKFNDARRAKAISENPEWSDEIKKQILEGVFSIGMTQAQVLASLGQPSDINRTVSDLGTDEQWVYEPSEFSKKYLYFEDGVLRSYQD